MVTCSLLRHATWSRSIGPMLCKLCTHRLSHEPQGLASEVESRTSPNRRTKRCLSFYMRCSDQFFLIDADTFASVSEWVRVRVLKLKKAPGPSGDRGGWQWRSLDGQTHAPELSPRGGPCGLRVIENNVSPLAFLQ